MNKFFVGFLSLLVGLGLGFLVFHQGATKSPVQGMAGAQVQNDTFNFTGGFNAGTSNQFAVSSTGAVTTSAGITNSGAESAATYLTATIGSSSSSPAALGSGAAGHLALLTGAATIFASTTAVTANSTVQLQQELTTPIAGTTCNTTVASGSQVSIISAGANSGFKVTVPAAPITNPFCFSYDVKN